MLHGNQEQIYKYLYNLYKTDYRSHFRDMYEGHNHLDRMATRYAVKNTVYVWREEQKKRRHTDARKQDTE